MSREAKLLRRLNVLKGAIGNLGYKTKGLSANDLLRLSEKICGSTGIQDIPEAIARVKATSNWRRDKRKTITKNESLLRYAAPRGPILIPKLSHHLMVAPNTQVLHGPPIPKPLGPQKIKSGILQEAIDAFYASWEWKRLRYDFLKEKERRCQCCGATPGGRVVIHVDHVRPIRKHWHLRLDASNLQILCQDCNMGKGSRDETDWREAAS